MRDGTKTIVSFSLDEEAILILKKMVKETGEKSGSRIIRSLLKGNKLEYSDRMSINKIYQELKLAEKDNELLKIHMSQIEEEKIVLNDLLQDKIIEKNNLIEYIKRMERIIEHMKKNKEQDWRPSIKLRRQPQRPIQIRSNRRRPAKKPFPLLNICDMKIDDEEQPGPDDHKTETKVQPAPFRLG